MSFYKWYLRAGQLTEKAQSCLYSGFDGQSVPENSASIRINLTSLVQALTMHAVLKSMYRKEMNPNIRDEDILKLCPLISKVWIASKQDDEPCMSDSLARSCRYENNRELQKCLKTVFKIHGDGPENALSMVVHGFEMMWRVVLRLFLEVQFVSGAKDPEWWGFILKQYVKNATDVQFCTPHASDAGTVDNNDGDEHYWRDPFVKFTASQIVHEGLRLYLPMRQVYRACDFGPPRVEPEHTEDITNSNPSISEESLPKIEDMDEAFKSLYCRILAADLESCLLDDNVWGKETHRFDPARWCKIPISNRECFVTFGSCLDPCPAAEEYGARMVGVLVGALLVGLQGDDGSSKMTWSLECRDSKVMAALEAKGRLSLERNAYDNLMLVGTR
jgi:hypothetical protein